MSADYQDTIANYLARKENIRYAMEVASSVDAAKTILRRSFWDALQQLCREYIDTQKRDLELQPQPGKANSATLEELWICPKGNQAYSLCYSWQDESNIAFGLRYPHERYVGGTDLFAGVADVDGLLKKVSAHLPKSYARNPFWLCWRQGLGSLYEASDLEKIAEDARDFAKMSFEPFRELDEEFQEDIAAINRSLASLKVP